MGRMSWFLTVLVFFLSFTTLFSNKLSEAKHHPNKLPSAAVVGSVYCDTCFHQDFPNSNHFIQGATVAVECRKSKSSTPYFRQEAKTNSRGEFRVELPFSVSKHVRYLRACSVALIRSNQPFCAAAAAATSSSLRLKSRSQGKQIFSAGFFTFKPQVCDESTNTFKNGGTGAADRKPSTRRMAFFFLPPVPFLPPPSLVPPVLPTPPPSLIPPVLPTPPPSVIPPVLPTPPSSPAPFLPLIPPVPGLIPSPPPPPPPALPVPLPPLPSLPTPPALPVPLPPLPSLPTPPALPVPLPPVPSLPTPPSLPVPLLPPPLVPGGPPAKVSSETRTSHP